MLPASIPSSQRYPWHCSYYGDGQRNQKPLFSAHPVGADVKGRRVLLPIGLPKKAARPSVYAMSGALMVHKSSLAARAALTGVKKAIRKELSDPKRATASLCAAMRGVVKWVKSDMFVGIYTS